MGFEIPVDVDYFEHPKTLTLVGLIGPEADVFPLRLWRWCALYARDGFVKGGRAQVESAVKWNGEAGKLHRAMVKCGFLEKDGKTVHDWHKGIGRAIHLYEQKKLRQRERYAAGSLPEETGRIPPIRNTLDEKQKHHPAEVSEMPAPSGDDNLAPHGLAWHWRQVAKGKARKEAEGLRDGEVGEVFAEMIGMQIPPEKILAEIKLRPPDRDRSEYLWQFKKRLMGEGETKAANETQRVLSPDEMRAL